MKKGYPISHFFLKFHTTTVVEKSHTNFHVSEKQFISWGVKGRYPFFFPRYTLRLRKEWTSLQIEEERRCNRGWMRIRKSKRVTSGLRSPKDPLRSNVLLPMTPSKPHAVLFLSYCPVESRSITGSANNAHKVAATVNTCLPQLLPPQHGT